MAFVLKDRVKESTTSAGTGAISLGGAAATFDTFQSVLTDGATTYYAIVHTSSGTDEWEIGLGTWNTGNTLTRDTILSGSNGTSAVDFSAGIKDIFMTYPASKAVYQNADSSVTLPDGLSVMGIIDGATSLEVETHIDLNTTDLTKPAHREGRIFYDEEYGALAVYNGEADITLQVGQEEWVLAYNGTGASILDGTPVYAIGAVGEAISIAPADATTEEKARVVGLATHTIEDGTQGYVTIRGLVSGLDTSSLTAGEPIHLSPSGGFQNAAPTYPYYPTDLGYCITSDASNGYVYVQPVLHTYEQFRVTGNQHVDGNLVVDGDLTITGTQSVVNQASLAVDDSFIYLNSGDTIGVANTAFSGTGLDDATLVGHYTGANSKTYYVRIDGVGTGTGGVDTFEWSTDNFTSTVATGVDCTTTNTSLSDGVSVRFNADTGHTSGDTWSGTAAPVNVDSGTFANRNTGATGVGYTHMGWFFDVSANKFVFLEAYDPEPEGTIDLGDASVTYATLKAGAFEGNLTGNVAGNVTGDVSGTLTGNSSGTHTGPVVGNVTGNVTGNASTATALATSRTIQLTGDVVGSATFNGTANAVINASVQDDSHAHIISNVDGLQAALDAKADDITTITAGSGLTGGGSIGANRTISHADTSTQASLVALSGAAVVSDVDVDTYGHVTGLATRNMTLADLGYTGETNATADQTITAGSGLTGGGTGNVTLNHADTSSQGSVNNAGAAVIQDVTLDTYGHVTGLSSTALTPAIIGAATSAQGALADSATQPGDNISTLTNDAGYTTNVGDITGVTAGSGITGGGTSGTVTINHADTSSQASVNNSGRTYIQDITLDTYGHITGITSATETVVNTDTTYSAGAGLNLTGTAFSVTDAPKWTTARTLSLTGDASGSVSWDGSGNASLSVTVADDSHNHTVANVDGLQAALDGKLSTSGKAADANLLDGIDSSSFLRSDTSDTMTGNLTVNGNIVASGDVTAFSDERLKSNIKTIDSALEKVQNLRGVTFDKDGKESLGVIAQEVQKVIPEVVNQGEEYLSVAYGNMVGLLIEAIKEQQQQIEELKARLE